jgi:hypothetical protein
VCCCCCRWLLAIVLQYYEGKSGLYGVITHDESTYPFLNHRRVLAMQFLKARDESSLLHLREVGSGNVTVLEWIFDERTFVIHLGIHLGVFKMAGAGCRSKGTLHLLSFVETWSEALNFEKAAILDQLVLT